MHLLQASGMLCACRHYCDLTWLCIAVGIVLLNHQGFATNFGYDFEQRIVALPMSIHPAQES